MRRIFYKTIIFKSPIITPYALSHGGYYAIWGMWRTGNRPAGERGRV